MKNDELPRQAFGAPSIAPRWTSSAKEGVGTAYHSSSRLWFTLSHGIVNEIYFPYVDTPNTRDLQFLITDGESFCHEEKRDLRHEIELPEPNALLYRLINSERNGRYRLTKEVIADPHAPVLLMQTRVEIFDPALRDKLRLYVLLAPHVKGSGKNNSAWWCGLDERKLFDVLREDIDLSLGCEPDFLRRSTGYAGSSDGWQDLMDNFQMDWEFAEALSGNVALIGEVDLSRGLEFTIGVGFGQTQHSASAHMLQPFTTSFADHREKYVQQWQRSRAKLDLSNHSADGGRLLWLSRCVLLAHEDKTFQGAFVASLSIPWGETKGDSDRGGYHLVWTRDMVQTASALLACGGTESPLRALVWLACVQAPDGRLPQNSFITGEPYWTGLQLDEMAAPILLAWRVKRAGALRRFDPWPLVSRAARYLVLNGPVTAQERWEEASGYSPSTLATVLAAIACAAELARDRGNDETADFLLDYADWLSEHIEEWTVTNRGELVPGIPRHYIRITPADPRAPIAAADPDEAELQIANGGGRHPARNIVGGDFLQLVRLGVRDAHDPLVVDSLKVIDAVLKRDLPQGPCWRRYNHDGYGDKPDGSAYDGTGEGRSWPILTGERGHYELAAGRDPLPFIETLEKFSNAGGMLPEQLWDAEDLPGEKFKRGQPAGSAMPLCWSHAEYISLVRSRRDGVCFDRIEPVYERYAKGGRRSVIEAWTLAHPIQKMSHGTTLFVVLAQPAAVQWSTDAWANVRQTATRNSGFGCWVAELPTDQLAVGDHITFTFQWETGWEGKNFEVVVGV